MNATLVREPPLTMRFALEPYSEKLVQEMRPLWDQHFKEISANLDIPLDPDLGVYSRCQTNGTLRIFTARLGSGWESTLVGYNVFFVAMNPHYKSSKQANQDILFLDEELRKGLVGYKFLKWCDLQLKNEKVQVIYHHIKAVHDFGHILERMGYKLTDLIYSKRMD